MPRRVLVERGRERFDLVEVAAPNELVLQDVMKAQPQLIPVDDLGLDGELLVVGRETTLASGKIDLLCLSRSGELVIIEFKTGPQNPDFRHALAQVLDYGSDLWQMSLENFDRGVVQRYLHGPHVDAKFRRAPGLKDALMRTDWQLTGEEEVALYERLGKVLSTGDFHYAVAAQRFTGAMRTSLQYLNETMKYGRFFLLELVRLEGGDLVAHAAQVVEAPSRAGTGAPSSARTDLEQFLARIPDAEYRESLQDVLTGAAAMGLAVTWGSKGASIRLKTPDRAEPISVAWAFAPGDQWYGAKHLTLGFDPATLEVTPSARVAVEAYQQRVSALTGALATAGQLRAATFTPAALPGVKDEVVSALEDLVEAASQVSS